MEKLLPTDGNCPYCGKKFNDYNASSQDYGSPVRKCRYCKKEYLDERYHEIAIEGYSDKSLNVKNSMKVIPIGLILFVIAGGMSAYTIYFRGYYMMKGVAAAFGGLIIMIFGIVDAVRIKTGLKARSLENKKEESEKRLRNKEYAQLLSELGYPVPDKYLN